MDPVISRYVENILNTFNDGLYITAPDGTTLWVNKMYVELTGLQSEEIIGHNVRTLVSDGVFDQVLNPEIVTSKRPATHAQRLANGKTFVLSGYPVLDESGEIRLVVTFVRDITRLTELTDNVSAQKKLIERLSDSIAYQTQRQAKSMTPIYASKQMSDLLALVERVAVSDATLLIMGETGTGKDVLARYAHEKSLRSGKPFLKVDCGGLTESLTESELFGYVAGAFTGAGSKGKAGYFEMADGGTVFLDEVGELSLTMQSRLLRVLQDHEIMRVGDTKPRNVDVRIIAATNRDLNSQSEEGLFRRDLFYRLNETSVIVPPLRKRTNDIGPLAEHFFAMYTTKYRKNMSLAQDTLDALKEYHWPGNVRELQNVVHNLVITRNPGIIHARDLPLDITSTQRLTEKGHALSSQLLGITTEEILQRAAQVSDIKCPLKILTGEFEREILRNAIKKYGSISKTAEIYGINRTTLFRKMRAGKKMATKPHE